MMCTSDKEGIPKSPENVRKEKRLFSFPCQHLQKQGDRKKFKNTFINILPIIRIGVNDLQHFYCIRAVTLHVQNER